MRAPSWSVSYLQVCCVASILQVLVGSRHLSAAHNGQAGAPFKTSFVLSRDYATRRSGGLVSLPLVGHQPMDDGLLMDEEDLESASDELTTRELGYLRGAPQQQSSGQPHSLSSNLERRSSAEPAPRVSVESSELATIELEDPLAGSSAENASTSVVTPVPTTGAPTTTTTREPTTTTTTVATTAASQPTTTSSTTEKPEPRPEVSTAKPEESTTSRPATSEAASGTQTASSTARVTELPASTTPAPVTQATTTTTTTTTTSTPTTSTTTTTVAPIADSSSTTTTTTTAAPTPTASQTTIVTTGNGREQNATSVATIETTTAVPVPTIRPPVGTGLAANRSGRVCDFNRLAAGCDFQVAEVPVLESQLDSAASNNRTRVVSEFVVVPSDSGPLTFEDSAYPARLSNETELKAEHRAVDGDEVEVDYVNSESDTTTKFDLEVSRTTPATSAGTSVTARASTSTSAPTSSSALPAVSTTTTTTTTTTTPSTTTATSTTPRPTTARARLEQVSTTTQAAPTTGRASTRANQKFLRLTDAPTSGGASSSTQAPAVVIGALPVSSVSTSVSRHHAPTRVSSTRSHRLFFSEPESEPRRRHKYASIAADEEEMKILTRYPIISQLSRLSGSASRASSVSLQRTATQSPTRQLLIKKQAIEHNQQPLVDSETLLRLRQPAAKAATQPAPITTTSRSPTQPATTTTTTTLKPTTSKLASTTTTTTTAKPTTTSARPTTTVRATTTPVATTTTTIKPTTSASPKLPSSTTTTTTTSAPNFEERLTLIAVSASESQPQNNKTASAPVANRKKSAPPPAAPVLSVLSKVAPKQEEFSAEFELGSIEDQLAKDALHQRKWAADDTRRARANKYSTGSGNRQRPKPSQKRQQQQVPAAAALDSGLWQPDELAAALSSAIVGGDESSGSTTGDLLPGRPGIDYPVHADIPRTSFDCRNYEQSGFYADVESGCQAYHSCHRGRGGRHTFMCPNGTLFSQELLTCDWWYNVECSSSKLYFGADGAPNAYNPLGLEGLAR